MFSFRSKLAFLCVSLLFIVISSACSPSTGASARGFYTIAPTFSDFYREFGGEGVLGSVISPPFDKDGIKYQYVVAGLLAYNPNLEPLKRFMFSPVAGTEWKIKSPIEPAPANADVHYVNGHRIWEEVYPYYDQYGVDIIGLPLTSVMVNEAEQRYEQYFEGVGFYRNISDPPGQIHLLPYGDWMCGSDCWHLGFNSTPPSVSYVQDFSATEQLFLQASTRMGYGFTGAPLAAPRLGSDGNYQMVFENVVLYIDPADGHQIRLRPLPSWLGIRAETPVPEEQTDWLSFFPTQDGLGYNVPNLFMEYINSHGAAEYVGDPISEYRILTDQGYSQCFRYVCLEYHPTAPEGLQVRPHALGADYLAAGKKTDTAGSSLNDALKISATEDWPLIPSGQKQVIRIYASQNNKPVKGVQVSLVVTQPDGITKTYSLAPTSLDGNTSVELDPVDGANGSIVQYQVCVIESVTPQLCFTQSYTIWNQ